MSFLRRAVEKRRGNRCSGKSRPSPRRPERREFVQILGAQALRFTRSTGDEQTERCIELHWLALWQSVERQR